MTAAPHGLTSTATQTQLLLVQEAVAQAVGVRGGKSLAKKTIVSVWLKDNWAVPICLLCIWIFSIFAFQTFITAKPTQPEVNQTTIILSLLIFLASLFFAIFQVGKWPKISTLIDRISISWFGKLLSTITLSRPKFTRAYISFFVCYFVICILSLPLQILSLIFVPLFNTNTG